MKGWIYIGVNSVAKGIIRIDSSSSDPEERAKKLSSASELPGHFAVRYACWVADYKSVERKIHKAFAEKAIEDSPKWFRYKVSGAILAIREIVEPIFDTCWVPGIPPLHPVPAVAELTNKQIERFDQNVLDENFKLIDENKGLRESLRKMSRPRFTNKWINCPYCDYRFEAPDGPRTNFRCPSFLCNRMFNLIHYNKLIVKKS